METHDLPDDVLLVIFNLICPRQQTEKLIYIRKIFRMGAVNRQFKRAENLFWRQIVRANPLFRSKLKLTKYQDKTKILHLSHYFGCLECQDITASSCEQCNTPLCMKCGEYSSVLECDCSQEISCHVCRFCCKTCQLCDAKVCGNCTKGCPPCGDMGCLKCYEDGLECCACNGESCKHIMELVNCECKGKRYACKHDTCWLQETICTQCRKAICSECGYDCQNCSHRACRDCSKKVDQWYACKDGCIGSGLTYTKCHQCKEEFVYADKDKDVGHCGDCEPLLAEDVKLCKNCVDTCQKCHRKLCSACLNFHEPYCSGLIRCHKCQAMVTIDNYRWCHTCGREAGCATCAIACTFPLCDSERYCQLCVEPILREHHYDWVTQSFRDFIEYFCKPCKRAREDPDFSM